MSDYIPPPDLGLAIIHEDEYLLVLNKPSGLLSVPGRGAEKQDSLAVRAQARYPDALIVHRLDMETSGLIVLARGKLMHRQLSLLFQERRVHKHYVAVVEGIIAVERGEVDHPLITDWPNRPRQKIDVEHGKAAHTRFQVLQRDRLNHTTRVELEPVTGRSHQLRVHMQSLGHAILGDRLYASAQAQAASERLLLHACRLAFQHPVTQQVVCFSSEAPFR